MDEIGFALIPFQQKQQFKNHLRNLFIVLSGESLALCEKASPGNTRRPSTKASTDMDHATGWPIPAGVPRGEAEI